MQRILIIGNSGSGKSWLGECLSESLELPYIGLDKVFWEAGGLQIKRDEADVYKRLQRIKVSEKWVVEGVFGKLITPFCDVASFLIFLDLPWKDCREGLLSRGTVSEKLSDPAAAKKGFNELLQWASEYNSRKTKTSHSYHNELFEKFCGKKVRLQSREEINEFCEVISTNKTLN
ncbi:AAA family ATPase [Motiliproteus coralliicola]|uniref:AAA family ATPase n=1 Tax=Motiliproteus coralliicola TaxID=2283196 RepID=A0A369WC05_9GAMM|nr:AAA family ATPase [Motiliproteus coralliicola]